MSNSLDSPVSDGAASLKTRFLEKMDGSSVVPSSYAEALSYSSDPMCATSLLACAIEKELSLAVATLKLANSPLFSGDEPVARIQDAVVRLGMARCRNLIITTCVETMMQALPLESEWTREVLNEHSVTTAAACTVINEFFELGFCGEEYAAGLLHDFGRLALAVSAPHDFGQFDVLTFEEGSEQLDKERELTGTDHCEFGAWYVDWISLPSELAEPVRWHHHSADQSESTCQLLVSLVRAADHLADFIQRQVPVEQYSVASNAGIAELGALTEYEDLTAIFETNLATLVERVNQFRQFCEE